MKFQIFKILFDPLLIPIFVLSILSRIMHIFSPLLLSLLIDNSISIRNYNNFISYIILLIISTILVAVLYPIPSFFIGLYKTRLFYNANKIFLKNIMKADKNNFDKYKSGELISVLSSDLNVLFSSTTQTIFDFTFDIIFDVLIIVIMINISLKLTILLFIFGLSITTISFLSSKSLTNESLKLQKNIGILRNLVIELLSGIFTIKSFLIEKLSGIKFNRILKEEINSSALKYFISTVAMFWNHLGSKSLRLFILFFIGYNILQGKNTIGDLVLILAIGPFIFGPFYYLMRISKDIRISIGAYRNIKRYFPMIPEKDGDREIEISGKIEFKDVWFKYEREEWILKGLNFSIKEREKVSIVGRSGVGKTTITNILLGYYSPQKGKILIDGNDLFEIKRSCLRSQIAVIPQNIFIFSGTLKENILLDYDVKEKELENVLDKSGINEMLGRLPEGMETELGERGFRLSGGEKQRIAIARVLLRKPSIVLFDEATSSLDNYSEKCINNFLTEWGRDKAFITIAHRLSTIRNSERIIFIEDGIVKRSGSHEELLKIPAYNNLLTGENYY